jgi:hypothetical protein
MLRYVSILFLLFVFNTVFGQNSIQLILEGKSKYKIAIATNADEVEKKAATVLQKYLAEISGCTLPITQKAKLSDPFLILVGRTVEIFKRDTIGLGEDGILLKQSGNNLCITGGSRKGVLYSAYTFLEDYLGCQGYAASEIEIPKQKSIKLPANLYKKYTPSFSHRMTLYIDAYDYNYYDWRKLNYYQEDWGLWVHSFEKLLPKEQYFARHPEYYALVNGERTPAQLDLTNKNVLRLVIENLRKLMDAKPNAKYWSVSQNDNKFNCQCANCTKLDNEQNSPQGSLLTFVNAVARSFPDKVITTLAYDYTEKPPQTLKPEKNVMIMLCTGSSKDRRIPLASYPSLPFNNNFKIWSQICPHLFLWDYIAQYDHVFLPFPNLTALQPNIRYFASRKVYYLFEQGIADIPGEFSELKCYLVSKLMWNKDIDVDATRNSFLNRYYGPTGGPYMLKYINLLHNNVAKSNTPVEHFGKLDKPLNTYLSPENISIYKNIFKKALSENDTSGIYGKRILKEYTCVLYAELEGNKLLIANQKRISDFDKRKYLSSLDNWYKNIKALNLKFMSFAKLSSDDYYKMYVNEINNK